MNKVRGLWSLAWIGLLLTAAWAADTDGGARLFPFPVVEAERMVSRWFMDSGYRILVEDSAAGGKQVSAQKADESWRIVLKPSSPLYTEVFARCAVAGAADAERLETLWSQLDRYTKGARTVGTSRNGATPKTIQQYDEAIICLGNTAGPGHIQLSGFVCNDSGLILTTAHDMTEYSVLTVLTRDGRRFDGRVIKVDHLRDLALIRAGFRPAVSISPAKGRLSLNLGETIYATGCPQGDLGTVYVGTVNSPPRLANAMPLWQVGMKVLPGSSGSPVFDGQGNLAGVIKGRYRGTDSVGFLIPVSTVLEFLGR